MYKTFSFNENAPNELLSALVGERIIGSLFDAISYLISEAKYQLITPEHLKRFLEETFWASILTEEQNFHPPSVSLSPPVSIAEEHLGVGKKYKFLFKEPIPFEAKKIAKLASALEETEHHLGVWINESSNLEIWGFTSDSQFIAKAIEVGQILLVKRGTDYKIERKILIDNSKITFVKNFDTIFPVKRSNVFKKLAEYLRNHRHGGTLLVVSGKTSWNNSIDSAIYFNPPNPSLKDFTDELVKNKYKGKGIEYRNLMGEKHLKLLGRITAPDGATIVNQELEIIAFAAKIKPKTKTKMTDVTILEPFEDSQEKVELLSNLGGTRHQSAARFVFDQENASFAIVSSQDGKVSIMNWDKEKSKVRILQHVEYLFV